MGRHCARSNCPFCGWQYTQVEPRSRAMQAATKRCWVECCSALCGATGPVRETAEQATAAWNERAQFRDRHGNEMRRGPSRGKIRTETR